MKLKTSLYLLALVTLALVGIPAVTASSPPVPSEEMVSSEQIAAVVETEAAPMCSADPTFGLPDFLQPVMAAGCGPAQCNASCRAQGYDYGTCLFSYCICRFYFP